MAKPCAMDRFSEKSKACFAARPEMSKVTLKETPAGDTARQHIHIAHLGAEGSGVLIFGMP